MLSAGQPAPASPAKAGQDGIFADHLAAASREKSLRPNTQKTSSSSENGTSSVEPEPATEKTPATEHDPTNKDVDDDPARDATVNDSAGAANAKLIHVGKNEAEAGNSRTQGGVQKAAHDTAVSRILEALTAVVDDTANTAENNDKTNRAPTNSTNGQNIVIMDGQALTSTGLSGIPGETTGPNSLPGANTGSGKGIIELDNTSSQAQLTVSFDDAATTATMDETGTVTTATGTTKTGQQNAALATTPQGDSDQLVQNRYGQIITIHQSTEAEERAALAVSNGGATAATVTQHQSMDINNNFIHSHLPNEVPKITGENAGHKQQDTAQDNQQENTNTASLIASGKTPPDSISEQKFQIPVGQENPSLSFMQPQTSASLIAGTASTISTVSTPFQLLSGLMVPDGTVVDQMIAHFSVNRQTESGSVNIKLYPQELGEVRMEIKVHQDNIKAHIIAQNPQAQEMIDRHLPRLREALEQQGLNLQHIEVTVATQDNTGGGRFQEHAGQQQLNRSFQNRGSQPVFSLDTDEDTVEAAGNLSVLA